MNRFFTLCLLGLAAISPAWGQETDAKELWSDNCMRCHGPDGRGDTRKGRQLRIKNLTSARVQSRLTEQRVEEAIAKGFRDNDGNERMPPFEEKLTESQRAALAAYVKTLAPDAD